VNTRACLTTNTPSSWGRDSFVVSNATDLDEFMGKVKDQGMLAVTAHHGGDAEPADKVRSLSVRDHDRARQSVHLILLQLRRLGWQEALFDCTGATVMLRIRLLAEMPPSAPFPTGLAPESVLHVLQEMAESPELGRETVEIDQELLLGGGLPGAAPRRTHLTLQSNAERPGVVSLSLRMPHSKGIIRATRAGTLDRIQEMPSEHSPVHVLVQADEQAAELAQQLTERLGSDKAGTALTGLTQHTATMP